MGDIDLSGITQTMNQSEAIAEFWVPSGLEDFIVMILIGPVFGQLQ